MEVNGQRHSQAALPPGKRPVTHCNGGWVDPDVGLNGYCKTRPAGDQTPYRPPNSEYAIEATAKLGNNSKFF